MKKLATLLALLLLSQSLLVSCASEDNTGYAVTTEAEVAETTAAETESDEPIVYTDDLGEYDFDKYEFTFRTRQRVFFNSDLVVERSGDFVDDAIYERNNRIEERFNVKFTEIYGESADIRNIINAGGDDIDLFTSRCADMWNFAQEGLFYTIDDIAKIDLDKGYWDKNLNEAFNIGGVQYFASGAFNLTAYDFVHSLVFNKEMLKDIRDVNLYSMVNEGKWTYDAFADITKNATSDMNGDTKMDDNDRYGLLSQAKQVLPAFWIAADELSIDRVEGTNYPEFNLTADTRFTSIYEKIFEITWDTNAWFPNTTEENNDPISTTMFKNNQGLFMDIMVFYLPALRDMETDFGILPYPKYDEAQENYLTRVEGAELFGVPTTAGNLERTGVILEALACDSQNNLIHTYYDVTLQGKVSRDTESEDMLDIIFTNRVFDFGDTILCDKLRDTVFQNLFKNNDRSLASSMAKVESSLNKTLADMVEKFGRLAAK